MLSCKDERMFFDMTSMSYFKIGWSVINRVIGKHRLKRVQDCYKSSQIRSAGENGAWESAGRRLFMKVFAGLCTGGWNKVQLRNDNLARERLGLIVERKKKPSIKSSQPPVEQRWS